MVTNINGQTINYEICGDGLPLIILHGLTLDSISMQRALEDTSIHLKGFKRIYIDMPGMGQSPAHNLDNNSDVMLDLICRLITRLISDHPFIIIGFSYGGYIAQGIASKFYNQILGEVLICPVVLSDPEKRHKTPITTREIDGAFLQTLDASKQEELMNTMVVINHRTYQRVESDFFRATALADESFIQKLFRDGYYSEYIETDERIHQHKALIFLGYQDNVVGYHDMIDKLDKYPKATVNLLTNASHSFFLEQPTQFEYILNSWLTQFMI